VEWSHFAWLEASTMHNMDTPTPHDGAIYCNNYGNDFSTAKASNLKPA
jgi:hypothetical protein